MTIGDRIFLIGYRGSGKSTVGRLLAAKLGWHFVDADDEIESRVGQSIVEIFACEGESGFRRRETTIMIELAKRQHTVIACGGGVILEAANRELLRHAGTCVWLRCDVPTILERIRRDKDSTQRPPLTELPLETEVAHLLAERTPHYQATAQLCIDTSGQSPEAVVSAILSAWTNSHTSFP